MRKFFGLVSACVLSLGRTFTIASYYFGIGVLLSLGFLLVVKNQDKLDLGRHVGHAADIAVGVAETSGYVVDPTETRYYVVTFAWEDHAGHYGPDQVVGIIAPDRDGKLAHFRIPEADRATYANVVEGMTIPLPTHYQGWDRDYDEELVVAMTSGDRHHKHVNVMADSKFVFSR